jgi:hypothetical protein
VADLPSEKLEKIGANRKVLRLLYAKITNQFNSHSGGALPIRCNQPLLGFQTEFRRLPEQLLKPVRRSSIILMQKQEDSPFGCKIPTAARTVRRVIHRKK